MHRLFFSFFFSGSVNGCSVGCGTGCGTGCSTGCGTGCGVGCGAGCGLDFVFKIWFLTFLTKTLCLIGGVDSFLTNSNSGSFCLIKYVWTNLFASSSDGTLPFINLWSGIAGLKRTELDCLLF